ncbi:MAG: response regulator, partial [Thiobacillus sp.]
SCRDYAIQRCTGPQQFAACLQTFRPDRVFTDLAMPGIDGFEIIRRVREASETLMRELENRIEQAVILSADDALELELPAGAPQTPTDAGAANTLAAA